MSMISIAKVLIIKQLYANFSCFIVYIAFNKAGMARTQEIGQSIDARMFQMIKWAKNAMPKMSRVAQNVQDRYGTIDPMLAQMGFQYEKIAVLRPGQTSETILFFTAPDTSFTDIWPQLKKLIETAPGEMEAAAERIIKRVNEGLMLKNGAREWGTVVLVMVEKSAFCLASGGSGIRASLVSDIITDASPEESESKRDKPLRSFVAGERKNARVAIYLDQIGGTGQPIATIHANVQPAAAHAPASPIGTWLKEFSASAHEKIVYYCRNPKELWHALKNAVLIAAGRIKVLLSHTSQRNRIALIALALFAIIALRSLFIAIGAQTVERVVAESLKRQTNIEALLANNKEKEALALIDNTLAFLDAAPKRLNATQKTTLDNIRLQLLKKASGVTKLSIIPDPKTVVSMEKSFTGSRAFDLQGLALAYGKLYTVNRAEKEIYELDGKERRIVVLDDIPDHAGKPVGIVSAPPGTVKIVTEEPLGILTLDSKNRDFTFDPIVLPKENSTIVAWGGFNDRLYLVDARTRTIYRYEKTSNGYDLWSPWSATGTLDLSQATAITIDGSMYVAFNDKNIVKLTQGTPTPFPIEKIRPPLERVPVIATKEDSPFIYLMDVPQRRIVIIDKTQGALIAQYMSPLFTDLRGIFPDEAAKRIYVLNGNTIYSVGPDDRNITSQ